MVRVNGHLVLSFANVQYINFLSNYTYGNAFEGFFDGGFCVIEEIDTSVFTTRYENSGVRMEL